MAEEVHHEEAKAAVVNGEPGIGVPGGFTNEPEVTAPAETAADEEPEPAKDAEEALTDEPKAVDAAVQVDGVSIASKEPELGDPDAPHLLVIESLRAQAADLISQVTQLNGKLVKSYDRVSDLEDDIHVTNQSLRAAKLKVTALELERTEHLSALNTGLLVEREHVTQELKSMMERVTEEAAQRGQAEGARKEMEKDLDDLSATLFLQANSMVAEARIDRARSQRRLVECEEALKGAEDVVAMVQKQMQDLREAKEQSDRELERMKETMGKGKYVEREKEVVIPPLRLMSAHLPYKEFMDFIAHLRGIRPTTQSSPPISTLLTLPFLARLITEDTDSTIRFDLAPSLNWLTRRSFTTAIQQGLLMIEPLHTSSLQAESASILTFSSSSEVLCGLCGCPIFGHAGPTTPGGVQSLSIPASAYNKALQPTVSTSWSTSRFLKSNPLTALNNSRGSLPSSTPLTTPPPTPLPDAVIHVFRLSTPPSQKPAAPYPLCQSGWCLTRLRTTCELWGFVRRGIVDRVWEDDITVTTPPPAIPPRKRMTSRMGFWGMGSSEMVAAPTMAPSTSVPGTNGTSTGPEKPSLPPRRHSEMSPTTPVTPPVRRRLPPPLPKDIDEPLPTLSVPSNGVAEKEEPAATLSADSTNNPQPVETTAETQDVKEVVPEGDDMVVKLEAPNGKEENSPVEAVPSPEEPAAEQPATNGEVPTESAPRPETPPQSTATESPTAPMSAPPPIPRRAAARTRGTAGSATVTESPTSPAKQSNQLPSEQDVTPPRVTSDAEQDDAFISAPSSPKSKPGSPHAEREVPPLDIPPSESKPGEALSVNGVTEAHIPEIPSVPHTIVEKASQPPPLPSRRPAPPKVIDLPDKAPIPIPQLPSPSILIEEAGFTSEANWEEKAWRELVRLKEDMFLARIGAVRADPSNAAVDV